MENEISILIVEDEALIAQYIKSLLEGFGYNIAGVVYNYKKAESAIEELTFDVLITDINLGDGIDHNSGLQLAQIVKQNKNCPIIFLTAFSDRDTIKKASALTPSAYLVKPVNAANLFASVQLAVNNFIGQDITTNRKEENPDFFYVKQGNKLIKINWTQVYHLEYVKNYVKVKTIQYPTAVLIRGSLKDVMENMLPIEFRSSFIKINRSEVIAKEDIIKIDKEFVETKNGRYKLGSRFDRTVLL